MSIDIDHLTIEELERLNHRIVERLKFLDTMQAHRDMMAFNLGTQVRFDSRQHGRVFGTIIKFNRKTVSVLKMVASVSARITASIGTPVSM